MKIKIIYFVLAALVVLGACSEEFLDRRPLDAISSGSYWKTPVDLEMYVNQYYTAFPFDRVFDNNLLDANSDDVIMSTFNSTLGGTRVVPASGGAWATGWSNIRSVNYFMVNYKKVPSDFEVVRQFVGEAYFFRAYFYFGLLRDFGDLPWVNKPLTDASEELYMPRAKRNVVMDSIIADLDKAIAYMKDKGQASGSRLNSQVAQLFKSRVALFEGTWEKYHAGTEFGVAGADGSKFLRIARDAAKNLIDGQKYSVYTTGAPSVDYLRLFGQDDYSNNPEIMLWKKFDMSLGLNHRQYNIWGMERGATKELVDSYLCEDGLPISLSPLYEGDANLLKVVKNRDPRLAQSIWVPGDAISVAGESDTTFFEKADIHQTGSYLNPTGYQLKKYSNTWGANLRLNYYQAITGSIIFRYAEALLNYAEARAELDELTQEDLDITINKLRDRVGMVHLDLGSVPVDPNRAYPALSPLINEIRRERRVELAFEGIRLHDFLRWRSHDLIKGKRSLGAKFIQADYPTMVVGTHIFLDPNGYIDVFQKSLPNGYQFRPDRDYLNAIPTVELTLNDKNVQNPNW